MEMGEHPPFPRVRPNRPSRLRRFGWQAEAEQFTRSPFASATMRWQAEAEQFTRRSATRSFNEVWQTHLISKHPTGGIPHQSLSALYVLDFNILYFYTISKI